jgi:hypothetical protein
VIPDNGFGTVALPPACPTGYEGPLSISVGLPAGTTIDIDAELTNYFLVIETPGGALGGDLQSFQAELQMTMTGTGALGGFNRFITMQVACETHTGPRTPGMAVQSFPSDFFTLTGSIFGDPDFDDLSIVAGTSVGLPSPGHTTLTEIGGTTFNVDSFFDVSYRISFTGAPGSILEGFAGTTPGTEPFVAGEPRGPGQLCAQPDNGLGTVDLPPLCPPGYDGHMTISTGLPPATTIEMDALFHSFVNIFRFPGGTLGGGTQEFDATLLLPMSGTGPLSGFHRTISLSAFVETHTAPRTPGDPVQSFDEDFFFFQSTPIIGDPDFDQLVVRGGTNAGFPSPGHTTLTQSPTGGWEVDSFFDICYQITFAGAPGSAIEGMSGTTTRCDVFYVGFPTMVTDAPPSLAATAPSLRLDGRPNPFTASTTLTFQAPRGGGIASLEVYDVQGRLVRTLIDGFVGSGTGTATWDGRDDRGQLVGAGIYFYRFETAEGSATRKATFLRP